MNDVKNLVEHMISQYFTEADSSIVSKLRDMVNKKTESRLIKAGGKMRKFTLAQASNIVALYDNQKSSDKAEFEEALHDSSGLGEILDLIKQ